MKQTISAVLTVKNEEGIIENCLDKLTWVDEIIIIDNNSTDNTVKICKKYTNKIYTISETLLIPELQQKGIEKATKKWVIILDADVIVPNQAAEEIQQQINLGIYDGFYLIHQNYFLGKPLRGHFKSHNILKLFKRGKGHFPGNAAHESIIFLGTQVGIIKTPLIHNSHPNINTFIRKANLYSSQDAVNLVDKEVVGILHKKVRKLTFYKLFIEPILYFFHFLLIRKAIITGYRGFILSGLFSMYLFMERIKMYELKICS
ncbi:MAG: glycosyltransferase family 2 protein [Candidatus Woesearchaeota archaeon]|jgi:glycosyltransferase involved in cell wall biosynthesis